MMRFFIFKAGRATRGTRERLGDFDTLFIDLLSEPGWQWEVFDLERGETPASLSQCDGVVITGSPASAYDDLPWVHELLALVRACRGEQIPLLGVCFGSQAVTQALEGRVEPNPAGWDIGLTHLRLTGQGRRYSPLAEAPDPLRILEVHQDIATRLPPGAVTLASSSRTPHEIYTIGERILCLQGHPELDNEALRDLIDKRHGRGLLDPERAAEGLRSLEQDPHRPFLQSWLRRFLREGRITNAA